jgi:hypothetical protein
MHFFRTFSFENFRRCEIQAVLSSAVIP